MQTDLRPDYLPAGPRPDARTVRRGPLALVLIGLVLALALALSGAVAVVRDAGEDAAIRTAAGPPPTATVLGQVHTSTAPSDPVVTTGSGGPAITRTASRATTAPAGPDTGIAPPVATTTAPAPGTTPSPAPGVAPVPAVSPETTNQAVTTASACRNSIDPACGPFRFDPQPGADSPMSVEVTVEPASPVAGQPMLFHVTLRDPDGVSYGASNFFFGESGIGNSTFGECKKHGPWDPPAHDPARASVVEDVGHTYAQAGSYTAIFKYEAGPFECVDSVTGRGDRPYSSSAVGTVTVIVK